MALELDAICKSQLGEDVPMPNLEYVVSTVRKLAEETVVPAV
jgi:hypothetical protein